MTRSLGGFHGRTFARKAGRIGRSPGRAVERRPCDHTSSSHALAAAAQRRRSAHWRRVSSVVFRDLLTRQLVKVLRGANPAEMPVEQPTQFELVVNVRTAKALRLTIPQAVLRRADRIIQ